MIRPRRHDRLCICVARRQRQQPEYIPLLYTGWVTLIQLNYLLGVVDNGLSMTAAAQRLHTSQPGISKQLRALEREVGVRLFVRKGKLLVGMTPDGAKIVDYARQIVSDVENVRSIGRDSTLERSGTLSIATTSTEARYVLPDVINRFNAFYPKVAIELHEGTTAQMSELVSSGEVDFVIASESQEVFARLHRLPCYRWDRIVLTRKDHPLAAANGDLSMADLAEYPLITHEFDAHRDSSLLRTFEEKQTSPNVVHTAHDADVIKAYVRLGMGVGILAPMAISKKDSVEFYTNSAEGLMPTVTTWIAAQGQQALQGYRLDFVGVFAPHWPRNSIEQFASADSKDDLDTRAAEIELPVL
ncbi:MAG: LysR substrate-binding domain-containing protein [Woeseiaceae bacterium]